MLPQHETSRQKIHIRMLQILKDKGGRKFLLLPAKKGIIMRVYPMEGGCYGYLLRPQGYAGTAPFHL